MNRNLRLKIEESISNHWISENLCFLCLACLNEKITYSKQSIDGYGYRAWRDTIAKAAIINGVDKSVIAQKIQSISKNDYPTFKAIERVAGVIQTGAYSFINGHIPDRMIHYKTSEVIEADMKREPVKRNVDVETETIHSIISFIKVQFSLTNSSLNDDAYIKLLQKIASKEYTYNVILQALKWYEGEIKKSILAKSFHNDYTKLCYIIGILKNYLPQTIEGIRRKENVHEKLLSLSMEIATHTGAGYKKRERKNLERFSDLW